MHGVTIICMVDNNTSTKEHFGCHAKERFTRQKIQLYICMVAFNQFGFEEDVSVILSLAAFLEANRC